MSKNIGWTIWKGSTKEWLIIWYDGEIHCKSYKTLLGANRFGLKMFGAKNFVKNY